MIKKLTKHGNSLALIIDKPILDLLRISEETELEVRTDGERLMIAPACDAKRKAKVRASMEKVNGEWADVFRRLAE